MKRTSRIANYEKYECYIKLKLECLKCKSISCNGLNFRISKSQEIILRCGNTVLYCK